MPTASTALTLKISEQLSPETLLNLIGVDPGNTLRVGDTLKCHCPCCGNSAFRTLFINTRRRTASCRYTKCVAQTGGDFVSLVALVRGIDELSAARALISELDLKVSRQDAANLADELQAQGLASLSGGDLNSARRLLQDSAEIQADHCGVSLNTEVAAKLAHCCWELGEHETARRHYRELFERLVRSGQIPNAVLMLSDLINVDQEWAPELHLMLGRLMRESGDVDQALVHLVRAAEALGAQGADDLAAAAAEEAARLQPDSDASRRALFEGSLARKSWAEALEQLGEFLGLCDAANDAPAALRALARLDDAGQLDDELRLERARRCLEAGDVEKAQVVAESLIPNASSDGELADTLTSLLDAFPEASVQRDLVLVRLFRARERWEDVQRILARLISLPGAGVCDETLREIFEAVEGAGVADLDFRRIRLDWLAKSRSSDVLPLARALLADAVKAGDVGVAEAAWRQIDDFAKDDLLVRGEALALLYEVTESEEHLVQRRDLVLRARSEHQYAVTHALGVHLIESHGLDLEVAAAVIEASRALGRLDEDSSLAQRLAEAQFKAKDFTAAEQSLRALIDVSEGEETLSLWDMLARTLEAAGNSDAASSILLARAEKALVDGDRSGADRLLAEARRKAPDRWALWREERALAQRLSDAALMESLWDEARAAASKKGEKGAGALEVLIAEVENGVVEGNDFVAVLTLLGQRDGSDRAIALFEAHAETAVSQNPEGQGLLLDLLDAIPPAQGPWSSCFARISNGAAVSRFQGMLAGLTHAEGDESGWRAELIQRAAQRWPESPETLAALAQCQRKSDEIEAAARTLTRLARLHRRAGEQARALEVVEELLAMPLEDVDAEIPLRARSLQAELFEASGDTAGAAALWLDLAAALIKSETTGDLLRQSLENARRLGGDSPPLLALEIEHFEKGMDADSVTQRAIALADMQEQQGDAGAALEILERCVKKFGDSLGLLHAQAETLSRAGQMRAATRAWRALLDRHWQSEEWSQCQEILSCIAELSPDEIEDVERGVELALRLGDEKEAESALTSLCDRCLTEGRWLQACEILKRLATQFEDPRPHLIQLGEILRQQNQTGEAVIALRSAIDICLRRGEIAAANPHIEKLSQWAATDVEARLSLYEALVGHWTPKQLIDAHVEFAESLRRMGMIDGALSVCQRALSQWPNTAELLLTVAEVHLDGGHEPAAAQCLRSAAKAAQKAGDLNAALLARRRVIGLTSAQVEDRWALVDLSAELGDQTTALEHLQWLNEHHRGLAQPVEMRRVCERILELAPTHLGALGALADACVESGGLEEAARHLLALAKSHLERNRRAPAERAYRQILEFDSDSIPALEGLFDLQEKKENLRRLSEVALRLIERYAEEDWDRAEALVTAMTQRHADADEFFVRWADLLHDNGHSDRAIRMLEERATAMQAVGRNHPAIGCLEHALRLAPGRVDVWVRIGHMALAADDRKRARESWMEALGGHRALGDIDGEHAVLELLHDLEPNNLEMTQALADAAISRGLNQEGIELLLEIAKKHHETTDLVAETAVLSRILEIEPGRPSEQRRLGQIHLACDRREEALNMLRRALAGFRLGKQWPEAADVAAEVERLDPDDHSVRQLHGEALVRAGQPEKAIQVFTGLGNLSQSEHDYLMAEVAWNAILELEPTHGLARSQLATILAAQGRVKDAVDLWLALADGHRRAGESQAERGVLMTLTAAQPHNAPAQRRLAALWLEAGESDSAWQAYRHLLLAAQEAGDPEAWAALEQEILAASDDFRIRIALAGLHIESGRPGPALRLFLEVAEAHRKNGNTQAVLATCQTILGHDPENLGALEMLNEVLPEAGDQSSISLRQVRSTLARVYTREGDSKKALGLLEAVAAECPEDPQTLEGLARIHSERGNREEFEKAIQRCADAIKKSAQAAAVTHFVQLCSELSGNCPNPDLVRDVMAQVILAARHEASHRDTLLEIAAAWGEGSEEGGTRLRAAELYESLIAALPTDADLRRRFVDFLVQQGQHTRAVNELLGLSEILTRSHRDRDVVKTLEQARAIDPENSSVLLQLGRALLAQNARGRALEILKHAATIARTKETSAQLSELLNQILELDPGDLDARREMVEALKREGRKEDAIDHQLLLADQCASRGFLDLAAQHYRAVIQARPTDLETWTRLIDTHLDFGAEEDLLPDYLTVARLCQGEGKWQEAVRWYQGYLRLEPKKIEVRQEFLEALEHVAKPDEMKREFAKMAEHCRDAGRETQWQMWDKRSKAIGAKPAPPRSGLRSPSFSARASQPTRLPERPTSRPPAPPEDSAPPRRGGGPPRGSVTAAGASRRRVDEPKAPRTPAGSPTSGVGEKGEDLRRLLSQYLSHLNSNPKNPKLHSQVAELYNHLGDLETAFSHWCEASELFFEQRMWSNCQGICEKLLKLSPNDSQIRRRLEAVRSRQPSSGGFTTEGPDTLF